MGHLVGGVESISPADCSMTLGKHAVSLSLPWASVGHSCLLGPSLLLCLGNELDDNDVISPVLPTLCLVSLFSSSLLFLLKTRGFQ